MLFYKRLVGKSGQNFPADLTVGVSFRGQNGVDAIYRGLSKNRILTEAFSRLMVTVDCSQGFRTNVRELARCYSNNWTVLLMKFFNMMHKGPRVHPFEIGDPRSCKQLWARVLSQRMNVEIIEDTGKEIA